MPVREANHPAFQAPGVVFMSRFWSKSAFFSRFGAGRRPAGRKCLGQNLIFLAQNVGHHVGTHHKLQSGRLVDSGAS